MSFENVSRKTHSKPLSKKRILLIDDHVGSLVPLNLILVNLGIEASLVFDGFTARKAMRDRRYDLVIIDWHMPYLNGGECLAFADSVLDRKGFSSAKVPFVIYTGLRENEVSVPSLNHFFQLGHWRKPMLLSELTRRLNAALFRLENR
jgi:PleD family two-component response regulator